MLSVEASDLCHLIGDLSDLLLLLERQIIGIQRNPSRALVIGKAEEIIGRNIQRRAELQKPGNIWSGVAPFVIADG